MGLRRRLGTLLSWRPGGKYPCPAVGGKTVLTNVYSLYIGNPYPIPYRNVS